MEGAEETAVAVVEGDAAPEIDLEEIERSLARDREKEEKKKSAASSSGGAPLQEQKSLVIYAKTGGKYTDPSNYDERFGVATAVAPQTVSATVGSFAAKHRSTIENLQEVYENAELAKASAEHDKAMALEAQDGKTDTSAPSAGASKSGNSLRASLDELLVAWRPKDLSGESVLKGVIGERRLKDAKRFVKSITPELRTDDGRLKPMSYHIFRCEQLMNNWVPHWARYLFLVSCLHMYPIVEGLHTSKEIAGKSCSEDLYMYMETTGLLSCCRLCVVGLSFVWRLLLRRWPGQNFGEAMAQVPCLCPSCTPALAVPHRPPSQKRV